MRNDIISTDNIYSILDKNHQKLLNHQIYKKENAVWNDYNYSSNDLNKIKNWVNQRISFLDQYFEDICKSTGLQTLTYQNSMLIYPNPAKYYFTVKSLSSKDSVEKIFLEILNIQGQIIQTSTFTNEITLSTQNLPKGMYLVKITHQNEIATSRLVVQ